MLCEVVSAAGRRKARGLPFWESSNGEDDPGGMEIYQKPCTAG